MTVRLNLKIKPGNTYKRSITYQRLAENQYQPIDITGATIVMKIFPEGKKTPIIIDTNNNKIIITNSENGEFLIDLKPDFTKDFNWKRAKYSLDINYTNGDVFTLMEGNIFLR